jgi:hypothetical protein
MMGQSTSIRFFLFDLIELPGGNEEISNSPGVDAMDFAAVVTLHRLQFGLDLLAGGFFHAVLLFGVGVANLLSVAELDLQLLDRGLQVLYVRLALRQFRPRLHKLLFRALLVELQIPNFHFELFPHSTQLQLKLLLMLQRLIVHFVDNGLDLVVAFKTTLMADHVLLFALTQLGGGLEFTLPNGEVRLKMLTQFGQLVLWMAKRIS